MDIEPDTTTVDIEPDTAIADSGPDTSAGLDTIPCASWALQQTLTLLSLALLFDYFYLMVNNIRVPWKTSSRTTPQGYHVTSPAFF